MANPSELELLEVILPEGYLLFEEEGRSFIHHRDRPTLSISIEPQHGVKDVLMLLLNERWEAGFEKGKAKPQEEEPEPLDTAVNVSEGTLCVITWADREKFTEELNAVIDKYRI